MNYQNTYDTHPRAVLLRLFTILRFLLLLLLGVFGIAGSALTPLCSLFRERFI